MQPARLLVAATGTSSYQDDEQDRPTSVISPQGTANKTVGYRYDLDGNRAKLLYRAGFSVVSSDDKADRLSQLQDSSTRLTRYDQYYPSGQLKHKVAVNGTTATDTLDADQRLAEVLNQTAGGATISDHQYRLDATGRRSQATEQAPVVGGGTTALSTGSPENVGVLGLAQAAGVMVTV